MLSESMFNLKGPLKPVYVTKGFSPCTDEWVPAIFTRINSDTLQVLSTLIPSTVTVYKFQRRARVRGGGGGRT